MDITASDPQAPENHSEIVDLIGPLRRYARAHVQPPQDADDVVQETLARVLSARRRLAPGSALAYSIVVARHVITDQGVETARARRHAHRLIDLTEPQRPDDTVVHREEQAALRDALADVPSPQRDVLLSHVLNDEPLATIAVDKGLNSGSVAAQLARTRARLRVDYVLALRNVDLPTQRCRPVLLALSAGDTRRQDALRAGQHLLSCPTCGDLSEPVLARRSALAAVLPWLGLGPLLALLRRLLRNSPGQVAVATATLVAVGAVAVVATGSDSPPPVAPPTPAAVSTPTTSQATGSARLVRTTDGRALLPPPADLSAMNDDPVRGNEIPVVSVPADEGFWIGDRERGRIWVQLSNRGQESKVAVRPDDRVSFVGKVATHGAGFARRIGVDADPEAALLDRQAAHLVVEEKNLRLTRR